MINIYKASAGSGKTFTLAREYIKLLLGRKDESGRYHLRKSASGSHRSVLAITFTNKATEEMKIRIIHELAVLAKMESGWEKVKSPYEESLTEEFGCSSKELSDAAAR
ncbi:MAG: UvrD-helicase domain-containing protein, partial [Duncaniella sp.]|nr:UvrD-helicase domain-containing protein [Duncaniella sp.]